MSYPLRPSVPSRTQNLLLSMKRRHHDPSQQPLGHPDAPIDVDDSESLYSSMEEPQNESDPWSFGDNFSDEDENEDKIMAVSDSNFLDDVEWDIDREEERDFLNEIDGLILQQEQRNRKEETFPVRELGLPQTAFTRVLYCAEASEHGHGETGEGDSSSTWDAVALAARRRSKRQAHFSPITASHSLCQNIPEDNNWGAVTDAIHKFQRDNQKENRLPSTPVKATKKVPLFLTTTSLKNEYLHPFTKRMQTKLRKNCPTSGPTLEDLKQFRVELKNTPNYNVLEVHGHRGLVEEFRLAFLVQLQSTFAARAFEKFMVDPNRYEVEVRIPIHALLLEWNQEGALVEISESALPNASVLTLPRPNTRSIIALGIDWTKLVQTSPLRAFLEGLLGKSAMTSPGLLLAIQRLDFVQPMSAREWLRERRRLMQQSQKGVDLEHVIVTLVVSSFTNLSNLVRDQLVGEVRRAGGNVAAVEQPVSQIESRRPQSGQFFDDEDGDNREVRDDGGEKDERQKLDKEPVLQEEVHELRRVKQEACEGNEEAGRPPEVIHVTPEVTTVVSGLDSQLPSEDDPRVNKAELARARHDAYRNFQAKFRDVYDIEYKLTDINYQFAISQMWNQHKKLIGSMTCEEDCPCAFEVGRLTENVVGAYCIQTRQKYDGDPSKKDWQPPANISDPRESPVGFVTNFVSKFLPKVLQAFPDENPGQTLKRLVKMWNLHLRQSAFGLKCTETCICEAGWNKVFHHGAVFRTDVQAQKETAPLRKETLARLPRKRSMEVPQERSSVISAGGALHKKRNTSREASIPPLGVIKALVMEGRKTNIAAMSNEVAAATEPPIKRKSKTSAASLPTRLGVTPTNHKPKAKSSMDSYCESFDVGEPLGFRCITKEHNDKKVCIITSVCPTGQSRTQNRLIQEGTCVEAVEILRGDHTFRYKVNGHKELRHFYSHAKGSIKLWFVNSLVRRTSKPTMPSCTPEASTVHPDWSSRGKWRGKLDGGWPGGAEIIKHRKPTWSGRKPDDCNRNISQSHANQNDVMQADSNETQQAKEAAAPTAATMAWSQVTQTRHPNHRGHVPDFSILRKKTDGTLTSGKVHFRGSHDQRVFDKDSASLHWLTYTQKPCSMEVSNRLTSQGVSAHNNEVDAGVVEAASLKAIVKAVRSNNIEAFLEALRAGCVRTDSRIDDEIWLDREYAFAKERGLQEIARALNIHRTARTVIALAQSLRSWTRLVVEVEQIMDIGPPPMGTLRDATSFEGIVSYQIKGATSLLKPLPFRSVPDSGVVDYRGSDGLHPQYHIHNNSAYPEQRALTIELQSTADRKTLAFFRLPFELLHQHCYALDKPYVIETESRTGEGRRMKIRFSARKVILERGYLAGKMEAGCKELLNFLEWINRFNDDYRRFSDNKLTAQICGRDGFSLLHAAIVLEKPDLVRKLLAFGADPNAKSGVGSAATYAMSAADHAREKLQRDEALLEKIGVKMTEEAKKEREAHVALLEQISQEILRHATLSQQGNDDVTQTTLTMTRPPEIAPTSETTRMTTKTTVEPPLNLGEANGAVIDACVPAAYCATPDMAKTNSNGGSERGDISYPVTSLCSALRFVNTDKDGWALESLVAERFYIEVGRKAKDDYVLARDRAYRANLIKFGRRNQAVSDAPIVSCGRDSSPAHANQRYLCLIKAGSIPFQAQLALLEQTSQEIIRNATLSQKFDDVAQTKVNMACPPEIAPTNKTTGLERKTTVDPPPNQADANAVRDACLPSADCATQVMAKKNSNRGSESGETIDPVSSLCSALRFVKTDKDGWALESLVAERFYIEFGRKLKNDYVLARDRAYQENLIKFGRRNQAVSDAPIVSCGTDRSPTYSKERYLCLIKVRSNPFQVGAMRQLCDNSSNLDCWAQSSSVSGKRRSCDAMDSHPPPKRHSTPTTFQGLQQQIVAPLPMTTKFSKVTALRAATDSTPVDVLGGVSKLLSVAGEASSATCRPHNRNGERVDQGFMLLLESTWNSLGEWTDNSKVAFRFYKKLGAKDIEAFKGARKEATQRGFVKWGRRDLCLSGEPIVETYIGQKEGLSFDTYLLLTDAGLHFLQTNGFKESEELSLRHYVDGRTRAGEDSSCDWYQQPASQDSVRGHRDPPPTYHWSRDMGTFLDLIAKNGKQGGWSSLEDVVGEFYRMLGKSNVTLMITFLGMANQRGCLEWEDIRARDVITLQPHRFRSVLNALLRLTQKGRRAAQGRVEHDKYQCPERRSTEQIEPMSSIRNSCFDLPNCHELQRSDGGGEPSALEENHVSDEATLPEVNLGRYWCTSGGMDPCKLHNCTCSRPHLSPPINHAINLVNFSLSHRLRTEQVLFCQQGNLFTAACYDRAKNVYFLSEGGHTGRKNGQGLYWYPSKALAKRALETAIAASDAVEKGDRPPQYPFSSR